MPHRSLDQASSTGRSIRAAISASPSISSNVTPWFIGCRDVRMNKGSLRRVLFIPMILAELGSVVNRVSKTDLLLDVNAQVHNI